MSKEKNEPNPEMLLPSSSKKSSQVLECPFEKDGVLEGIRKLTKEDGLMEQLVDEVKCSNRMAKHNNTWLKTVAYIFAIAVAVLLGVGILAWEIFGGVALVERNLGVSVKEQHKLVGDVKKLVKQQKKTDENATVELVAEQDPEKAKDAPIKVRIIPAKTPKKGGGKMSPAPALTAVEVPLPVPNNKKK